MFSMKRLFLLLLLLPIFGMGQQKLFDLQVMPLYKDSVPNTTGYETEEIIAGPAGSPEIYQKVARPEVTAYIPVEGAANGTAVIIFPGGAYSFLAFRQEGTSVAENLVRQGITAFVVKYRLPSDLTMRDKTIGPLQDAQAAIKLVRMHAGAWGIDTGKIGVMGFSAGGHLASSAGTHFNHAYIPNKENTSLRPDFMILVYPVISMSDKLAHKGSKESLLGPSPDDKTVRDFSGEEQVTAGTPPTWLTHAEDDRTVDIDNSIAFYEALHRHNIPAEMHLYPAGDHGFVLHQPAEEWMAPLLSWMRKLGYMGSRP